MSKTYNDVMRRYAEVEEEPELTKETIRDHRIKKRIVGALKAKRLEEIEDAQYED